MWNTTTPTTYCTGWDRVPMRRGLGCCAWAPTRKGETNRRGGWGLSPHSLLFLFFFLGQLRLKTSAKTTLFFFLFFFSCGPGGCPLPWLFNIPPAKTKGSRQQTSALLNGSKANLDPWIRTANQDRSEGEMQIKLRINQEAIRKCKSQRKAEVWLQACH